MAPVTNDRPPRRSEVRLTPGEQPTILQTRAPRDPAPSAGPRAPDAVVDRSADPTRLADAGPALPAQAGFRRIGNGANYLGAPAPSGGSDLSTGTGTGIGGSRRARTGESSEGTGPGAITRERARELIDAATRQSVSSSSSDDYVRNNITPEVLAHATPAEKAHMLRCLMDGYTGEDDERAMAMILKSVTSAEEMDQVLRGAGGADAVWDELGSQRDNVASHFRGMGQPGQEIILQIATRLSTGSSLSDDFVADYVDPTILARATNEQKSHMLRCLMDGPTVARDEAAMRRILESVERPDDMMAVINGAGGTTAVYDELEGERAAFMAHLRTRGEPGREIILRMAESFEVGSSLSDDFVRDHVDAGILASATPAQKAHLLRCLMDGPTGDDDERAMLRVLQTISTPAELDAVLTRAGGADAVWCELEGQQNAYIQHLRSRGDVGQEMIVDLAVALPVSSSASDDFVRNHIDATALSHATVDDKAAMVRRLRDGVFSTEDRRAMERVLLSAANPVELMTIADRAGGIGEVLRMTPAQRTQVTDAYNAHSGDAAYTQSLSRMLVDEQFIGLSEDSKTAVLSQAANYPDARSVDNMRRLLQKSWFRSMSLEDQQRSLKTVAFLSQHAAGDRTLIDNTLDRFLSADSRHQFGWNETGTPYGSAGTRDFDFNRRYLPAGNGPVDTTNPDTMHMVTHTVAHEVNHIVNNDRVRATADYFLEEYRAFYVGFRAENGRDPTRAEVIGRVRGLITATDGAYDSIRRALADPTEGPKIVAFLQGVLGRNDITQANAATLAVVDPNHTAPRAPGDHDN